MRIRTIKYLNLGVVVIMASSAFGLELRTSNSKISQVGIFERPTIKDSELIENIAESGAPLTIKFSDATDIARFVRKKCGRPSVTINIHPEYEKLLLSRNSGIGLTHEDLTRLRQAETLEIPACAKFSKQIGLISVSGDGMVKSLRDSNIQFDYTVFAKAVRNATLRKKLSVVVALAGSTGDTGKFEEVIEPLCGNPQTAQHQNSFDQYLSCVNAATIAGANPSIRDPKKIRGKLLVPIAGKIAKLPTGEDAVPLRATEPHLLVPIFGEYVHSNIGIGVIRPAANLSLVGHSVEHLNFEIGVPPAGNGAGQSANLPVVVKPAETRNSHQSIIFSQQFGIPESAQPSEISGAAPRPGPTPPLSTQPDRVAPPHGTDKSTDNQQIALALPNILPSAPANPSIRGLIRTQHALNFVTELNSPEKYQDCADAGDKNRGAWPFDVAQFERAAKLSGLEPSIKKGKILIADTGFDFAGDASDDQQLVKQYSDLFPRKYFHVLEKTMDPDLAEDLNRDGVYGNGGWAGVNLAAATAGDLSAKTNVNGDNRTHGLSVTTLALGGRGTEELRKLGKLNLEIGEVSLVPSDNPAFLASTFVTKTIDYAQASGNEFDVVNFSLSSDVDDGAWNLNLNNSKRLALVVAAGNDGIELTAEKGVFPAAYGGSPVGNDPSATVVITVGSHNGKGQLAAFSNWGVGVDILAPGCAIPSYILKTDSDDKVIGVQEHAITGTSASTPIVSFVAGLLAGDPKFQKQPGWIKMRIQVGSDYDAALRARAFSSGILNVAKSVGFKYDILELTDKDKAAKDGKVPHKLRYGKVSVRSPAAFQCGFDPPLDFSSIKKIARGKSALDPVFVLATDDPTKRMKLDRHFCPPSSLDALKIDFQDVETNTIESINIDEVWDYVAKR